MEETKKQRKSQKSMVKEKLMTDGSITSWEAIQMFGATRLSAIIYDLRKEGLSIISTNMTSKNRFGNSCTFTKYTIVNN